uniref:Uncharacterized protein n=1 Tax=Romanomermis culicivorax TaxID=13658 RepID=A0A915J8T4_ROMCU
MQFTYHLLLPKRSVMNPASNRSVGNIYWILCVRTIPRAVVMVVIIVVVKLWLLPAVAIFSPLPSSSSSTSSSSSLLFKPVTLVRTGTLVDDVASDNSSSDEND